MRKEGLRMKILPEEIVSSTDMIKNFKACREKTKKLGKTFIFKNNNPEMVLMDIEEYTKMANIIDELERIEIYTMLEERKKGDTGKRYSLDEVATLLGIKNL